MNSFERTLALAGVCQAANLVQQIAKTGKCSEEAFKTSLNSIVMTSPESTEAVYGTFDKLEMGFEEVINQLSSKGKAGDSEVTRYVSGILNLERKLSKKPAKLQELAQRIEQVQRQQSHISLFENQMIHNLAVIYKDIVSPLGAKIQVVGEIPLIKQNLIQDKIRALLLASLRSAVLWRQLGGSRRELLFKRRRIINCTEDILSKLSQFKGNL